MTTQKDVDGPTKRKRPPATTPEGRENQMIALAFDQAELQLREGVAPAPVVVHYLKLATEREKLEREKLRRENDLLAKRSDQVDQIERVEALYSQAIESMRHYQGADPPEAYEDYDG